MRRTTLFAVVASALMLLSVAGPAVADDIDADTLSVSVTQADSGEATVTVEGSSNGSSVDVAGANVTVEVLDANTTYEGSGDHVTDENGTVTLPAPNETVNVSVTASYENQTDTAEVTLAPEEENETDDGNATAFGQQVSSFVHDLQSSNNTSDAPLGVLVAQFVIANNPGNAPDHAGPPAWLLDDSVNKTTGPPAHAGPPENNSGGPPENKTTGPSGDKGGGPPDDKGKDKDEAETESDA